LVCFVVVLFIIIPRFLLLIVIVVIVVVVVVVVVVVGSIGNPCFYMLAFGRVALFWIPYLSGYHHTITRRGGFCSLMCC